MLKNISLSNFKSFENLENLEVKNLTILVGKNSCGKSSIIQSLLLLKQTLESSLELPLALEGQYLNFSSLKDVAFGLTAIRKTEIGFCFSIEGKKNSGKISLSFKNKKTRGEYRPYLSDYRVDAVSSNLSSSSKKETNTFYYPHFPVDLVKTGSSTIKIFEKGFGDINNIEFKFNRFFPDYAVISFGDKDKPTKHRIGLNMLINSSVNELIKQFKVDLQNISYLSPVRAFPQRAYIHYSSDNDELFCDGSNAANVLWARKGDKINFDKKEMVLADAVNQCLSCMGLEQKVASDRKGGLLYKIDVEEPVSGKKVSVADVGFGYSQVLPVILMGLLNGKENLMLIEQPEIHLHPSSAANLADIFLKFIDQDKKFIIETHSQELINRLRLRVIQNPELKGKINIVFVESIPDSGSSIKQFSIDENGMFPEWPDGFLDESEKLVSAMLAARLEKMKSE